MRKWLHQRQFDAFWANIKEMRLRFNFYDSAKRFKRIKKFCTAPEVTKIPVSGTVMPQSVPLFTS